MRSVTWLASMVVASGCSLIVPGPGDLRPTGDGGGQHADGGGDHVDAAHHVDAGRDAGMHVEMDAGRDGGMDGGTDGGPRCDAPLEVCGGACVDTESDLANCGACGNACAETDRCNAGTCYDPVVEVAAGWAHTCARRASGEVWCWGLNSLGQLGDGTTLDRLTPVQVSGVSDATQIAIGLVFQRFSLSYAEWSCGRGTDGHVVCWGYNAAGQLGDGTTDSRPTATEVTGLGAVEAVSAGAGGTCGRSSDHQLYCWGGLDSMNVPIPPAALAPDGVTGGWVADSDLGLFSACAAATDGQIYCWGANQAGELGVAPAAMMGSAVPVAVSGVSGAISVAASYRASCALLEDGTVSCWGESNQLGAGLGTTDPHPSPIPVPGLTEAVAIDGLGQTCAVHGLDRRVTCWGDTPTEVEGVTGVADLSVGLGYACAALEDGSVVCWGQNSHGQLGDGTTEDRATPTPVVGLP